MTDLHNVLTLNTQIDRSQACKSMINVSAEYATHRSLASMWEERQREAARSTITREDITTCFASYIHRHYGCTIAPATLAVSCDHTHALQAALHAILGENGGDVLIPAPHDTSYPLAIALAGGHTAHVFTDNNTLKPHNIDWERAFARTAHVKAVILNYPHPLTGVTLTEKEAEEWAILFAKQWQRTPGFVLIHDEPRLGGGTHSRPEHSIFALLPRLIERYKTKDTALASALEALYQHSVLLLSAPYMGALPDQHLSAIASPSEQLNAKLYAKTANTKLPTENTALLLWQEEHVAPYIRYVSKYYKERRDSICNTINRLSDTLDRHVDEYLRQKQLPHFFKGRLGAIRMPVRVLPESGISVIIDLSFMLGRTIDNDAALLMHKDVIETDSDITHYLSTMLELEGMGVIAVPLSKYNYNPSAGLIRVMANISPTILKAAMKLIERASLRLMKHAVDEIYQQEQDRRQALSTFRKTAQKQIQYYKKLSRHVLDNGWDDFVKEREDYHKEK